MAAHVITIDTRPIVEPEMRAVGILHEYRWRCSCGRICLRWRTSEVNTLWGGDRHVAVMERKR